MEFTVNGTEYFLNEFYDGTWFWGTETDESRDTFLTPCEAQQNAIENERDKFDTRNDDAYNEATSQFFNRMDYQ